MYSIYINTEKNTENLEIHLPVSYERIKSTIQNKMNKRTTELSRLKERK